LIVYNEGVKRSYYDQVVTTFLSVFTKNLYVILILDEEFECLGKEMSIFLCFKSNVNTQVFVILGYQKLLKFINVLVYDGLTYITYDS
jgi:hypothetical protein